jgi:hypothetical protein
MARNLNDSNYKPIKLFSDEKYQKISLATIVGHIFYNSFGELRENC